VPARIAAFAAIVLAGGCGALIGGSLVSLQCKGNCTTPTGAGAIVGGVIAAVGVAVIAVLTLRAMGEWRRISEEQLLGDDRGDDGGDEGREDGDQDGYSSRNPSA
jgi:hypothetical protein